MRNTVAELAAAGLGLPLVSRGDNVRHLLRPLGWQAAAGFVGEIDHDGLDALADRLRQTPGDRLLISNEDLAEVSEEHVSAVMAVAGAAELDVRLVVSARDWAKQLPSEWQQLLKHRVTTDYETFLQRVRDQEGDEGRTLWRRQDLVGICDRWASVLDPVDVHVVPVPAASVDPDAVFRVFAEILGFDPSSLLIEEQDVNRSFGYVEAELLRRFNVALGPRLQDYEKEYMPAVRKVLIQQVMARGQKPRITLPPEHVDWIRTTTLQRLDTLRERGYTVHGDLDLLLPDEATVRPVPPVADAELAAAAVKTLADLSVVAHQAAEAGRTRRQQRREQEAGQRSDVRPLIRRWLRGSGRRPSPRP
jgi:hypothetical protein